MNIKNILLILFTGAIILHLFSLIEIPSLYNNDNTEYNELLHEHDSLKNLYDSIKYDYTKYKKSSDSIISFYDSKYDSAKQANNQIIKNYEERLKDINDITIVSNDSITEYISKRIYNR